MADIEIKRGYEVLPDNNIRFGIRITNTSDLAISDVEVTLDYPKSLFNLEGNRIQNLGNIPPEKTHTAEFVLKPLGCVHQINIEALLSYRDAKWNRQRVDMHPKEVHCVCPFLKGKAMPRAEFLELSNSGYSAEAGLNFKGISVERLASYLVQTCKSRHHKVDDYPVDGGRMLYLASESIGEKAYYLLTALIKEDNGLTQVMLRVTSDKSHGLNGFLNETVAELRHVANTVQSAQEIGVIKNEQVINIIDSIVQRSSFGGSGGKGSVSVNIQDSVVQRTEFNANYGEGTPIIEQSSIENWIKIGDVTFDTKYLKPRLDENSDYENTSGNTAAFGGKKWTKGAASTFVETPYGFIGISKTGVERGVAKKLENAVQRNEITVFGNIEPQLLETESEKQEIIENLHEVELQNDGESKDSKKRERPINQKRKTGTSNFVLAIVFVILVFGLWSLGSGSNDVQDVPALSSQPELSFNQKTNTNSIGMEFVLISAGEFEMGTPLNEGPDGAESPLHTVTIEKAYYIGKYEVTQKQWREVMGTNPSNFKGDDRPVEEVSWNDVQEFIRKLNTKEGTDKYRLPSEAEWEYAARAGTTTRYSFGDDDSGFSELGEYAWYKDNSGGKTHIVGTKKPNPWGLYDMHGNVREWVQDKWYGNYDGAPSNGSVWGDGSDSIRVTRGGHWDYDTQHCRSAAREGAGSAGRDALLGFRLLRVPEVVPESTEPTSSLQLDVEPEVVSELIEPKSSPQSDVESEVSPTPVPFFDQNTYTNSIGMEFVLILAGEFDMGSPSNEDERYNDEGPIHKVKISDGFYLGKYEVTQKQWAEVMGDNPSNFRGDELPVETISWSAAQEFIKKLNQKEGTDKYRLPSEAEWEYAARAGTTTRYSFGESESNLGDYAWYGGSLETHPVGQKKPNPWGLYDIHGNVWEFTQDLYHSDYDGAPTDGSAWESGVGSHPVIRGGSWLNDGPREHRSANRREYTDGGLSSGLGFRLLRTL